MSEILQKAREIQAMFKEKHGLNLRVNLDIFKNTHKLTMEDANNLLSQEFDDVPIEAISSQKDFGWSSIYRDQVIVTIFYDLSEEVPIDKP
ncbi:MAG: hypothetical protein ACYDG6_06935 [Thermincolia bacterium]